MSASAGRFNSGHAAPCPRGMFSGFPSAMLSFVDCASLRAAAGTLQAPCCSVRPVSQRCPCVYHAQNRSADARGISTSRQRHHMHCHCKTTELAPAVLGHSAQQRTALPIIQLCFEYRRPEHHWPTPQQLSGPATCDSSSRVRRTMVCIPNSHEFPGLSPQIETRK